MGNPALDIRNLDLNIAVAVTSFLEHDVGRLGAGLRVRRDIST